MTFRINTLFNLTHALQVFDRVLSRDRDSGTTGLREKDEAVAGNVLVGYAGGEVTLGLQTLAANPPWHVGRHPPRLTHVDREAGVGKLEMVVVADQGAPPVRNLFFPALLAPRVELEGSNIKTLCQDLARQLSSQHDGAKTANPALVISRPSEDVQRGPNMQLSHGVHKIPSGDPAKQVKNHQSLAQVLKSSNFLSLLLGPVDSQAFLLPPPIGLPIRHASSQAAISKGTARHVVSGKSWHVPIIHNETLRNSWEYSETLINLGLHLLFHEEEEEEGPDPVPVVSGPAQSTSGSSASSSTLDSLPKQISEIPGYGGIQVYKH
ncbi:hypothetical protein DFH07DRAFT_947649 [Mycena maculata]|uniref:Uncharacterized protein n=1 Tax=Mycena maculata TaxID=230809 RepID=A0AAD7HAK5_9AGAR|nr:hypothetical protein DFH07DRAFT_947649 [Mycena maculata]